MHNYPESVVLESFVIPRATYCQPGLLVIILIRIKGSRQIWTYLIDWLSWPKKLLSVL